MTAPATIIVNRRSIDSIIEQLIELIDNADRVAAIGDERAAQEAEG